MGAPLRFSPAGARALASHLGCRTLTRIDLGFALIERHYSRPLSLDRIPPDDRRTHDLICRGDTVGVFALRYAPTKRPKRLDTLLLVAALASFILWLLGLAAADRQWALHFQANTERRRPVLSTVFPGQELWRNHRFKIRIAEMFDR